MPDEFQRFIAAWELIVLWHRRLHPNAHTDRALKSALRSEMPTFGLEEDPEWALRLDILSRWNIARMSGSVDTGAAVRVTDPADWDNIVDGLYTVRCNLLKGGKQPSNPNDLALAGEAADVAYLLAKKLWGRA